MKNYKKIIFVVFLFCAGIFFLNAEFSNKNRPQSVSQIFDTSQPYSIIGVVPDVPQFIDALRDGKAMRAFFDSPLGLHFLRSAPTRAAAHLHRYIKLAPSAWQWNLYATLISGPVFYRSLGSQFSLVIQLNKKGKLISSLLDTGNAARVGDWLVIASDKATLKAQQAYLENPKVNAFTLDTFLGDTTSASAVLGGANKNEKKLSLVRSLVQNAFGLDTFEACKFKIAPAKNTITLEGDCPGASTNIGGANETITIPDSPFYTYSFNPKTQKADFLSLAGFSSDYGMLVPRLFYSTSVKNFAAVEFLNQAFKTFGHQVQTIDNGFQIMYPVALTYPRGSKQLFSPRLTSDKDRIYWESFTTSPPKQKIAISANYQFFAQAKIAELAKNSLEALKTFDAIYAPAHFNEFRDALAKSLPSLQNTVAELSTTAKGSTLRVHGTLDFAKK
ncbi:MAG: hypothetical protein LDLANPLL_00573 [Turneriella sp.]|nr:hypothetical protein [Turneriella sp.]